MALNQKLTEKLRFGLVGGFNTLLDFGLLFALVASGLDRIPANYISTGISFIFSFFANRSFTFKSKQGRLGRQFSLFIIVTLIGLWVIQPIIIWGVTSVFADSSWSEELILLVAKLIATVASLIWNYILYSRVVFKTGAN
ncbi:hypothetical protein B7Z17_03645 [Candidatus Saccharibacteria bacterium 32-49-10]|nr:MAG: hypothetical protein B7Z17_03645 [Candidatus Saccharibacteria bacterium 32-49-10]